MTPSKRKSATYRVDASHALSLEDGRMPGPGTHVKYDRELPEADQALVESGQLVEAEHVPDDAIVVEAPRNERPAQGGAVESPTISDEVSDSSGDNGE